MKQARIIPVIFLCIALILSSFESTASAETRVTVTIAGTTVVGGVYIVFYLALGNVSDFRQMYHINDALLNMDSNGWRVGLPLPEMVMPETVDSARSTCEHHVRLLKITF